MALSVYWIYFGVLIVRDDVRLKLPVILKTWLRS